MTSTARDLGQIIDDEGAFCRATFDTLASTWGLSSLGDEYGLVSVIGAQSSGKSTLLNMMFGTPFAVMDASAGRSQTTQGLWLSRDGEASDWLVLDVEGNDSRERGEDHTAFERKTALFSLALADVLIINTWCNDLGRYEAANLGILKTVFTCDIQLFLAGGGGGGGETGGLPRKTLYFAVRDYDDSTPQDTLRELAIADITKIWDGIPKPDTMGSTRLDDYFAIEFMFFPHYKYQYDAFVAAVDQFKAVFHARDADGARHTLAPPHVSRIPAGDLPHYADQIWATIVANKDLNLPSEREMLAIYRTDGISSEIMEELGPQLDSLPEIAGLGPLAGAALARYDDESQVYHAGVVKDARARLEETILARVAPVFEAKLADASATGLDKAGKILDSQVPKSVRAVKDVLDAESDTRFTFASVALAASEAANSGVDAILALNSPEAFSDVPWSASIASPLWDVPRVVSSHNKDVTRALSDSRAAFVSLVLDLLVADAKQGLEEESGIHVLLRSGSPEMWDELRALGEAATEEACTKLAALGEDLFGDDSDGGAPSSAKDPTELLGAAIRDVLENAVSEFVRVLPLALQQTFNDKFKFGPGRIPIRWKPGDDVDGKCSEAREAAMAMLNMFATNGLYDPPKPLLSVLAREQLTTQLDHDLRAAYMDAQAQIDAVSIQTQIPTWAIIMILILGFNEFWMILTNPLLLFTTLLAGAGATFLYFTSGLGIVQTLIVGDAGAMVRQLFANLSGPGGAAGAGAGGVGAGGAAGVGARGVGNGVGSSSMSKPKPKAD